MSQHDQAPSFCTLPPDAALLNRPQHLMPPVDYSFMSHIKLEHSNIGDIVDEEEEEEELSNEDIMEEDEEEEEEEIVNELQIGMEYDIHLLDQGNQQTSGRRTRTARMQVNTNYIRYNIQVPQSIIDDTYSDDIEEEEEEEEVVEEEDINEFVDQDMSEYFERSTCYVTCVMDVDNNEDGDDDEEKEACAICLLEYKDEDNIGTLQCGHEFHAECINKWLQRKKSCPFCRASVLPTNT
ncbi:E3 ubiquitin ligase BIG BROTHER-related-like [Solanum tuberosum]|uniref:RING-type E3 ubiquitin transferase n=1 Tax=Solanum tuberosum TaxID=4113 RepID=M1ADA7_SOLTU|nr:PREDICTED: E3 ubiquitin ligase BIG BROTHER-related-like [Solanum tuberosum]